MQPPGLGLCSFGFNRAVECISCGDASVMKFPSFVFPGRAPNCYRGSAIASDVRPRLRSRIRTFGLAAVLATLLPGTDATAEFLLTMESGVYQHTDSQTKVVIGTKQGARGIFVMVGPVISPQEFNLETTPKGGVKHVFIKFDEQGPQPTYAEVFIGGRSYQIRGNLTLELDGTLVGIDNTNPYLTVVTDTKKGKKPSILGFSGLNEVVRAEGPAATILAANQLNDSVASLIRPYVVEEKELTVNGKPVTTPVVGTFIKQENECLLPNAFIVTSEQLKLIQSEKTEERRLVAINQVLKDNKKRSPLKGNLVLKSDPQSVILLDIAEKNVRSMSPGKSMRGKRKICVISELSVK